MSVDGARSRARLVLAVRLHGMVDLPLTTPALRALMESGDARSVTLLTSPDGAQVARELPFIDDVVPFVGSPTPAACHADRTAPVQAVSRRRNPLYRDTIAVAARSAVPIVINTSFNTRGKPIVRTPRDALECFFTSPIDVLAIAPNVVEKSPS